MNHFCKICSFLYLFEHLSLLRVIIITIFLYSAMQSINAQKSAIDYENLSEEQLRGLVMIKKKYTSGDSVELEVGNYVVIAAFGVYNNAKKFTKELNKQGYVAKFGYLKRANFYYIYLYQNESISRTIIALKRMQEKVAENILLHKV